MSSEVDKVRQQIIKAGVKMAGAELVTGPWGNISARVLGEELFVITPSGMSYDALELSDLVVVLGDGCIVSGERKPSTELKMHLAIYHSRMDAMAVVHTHSTYASALAVAGKPLPPILEDQVQLAGGEVPVARYARAGTEELAAAVAETLVGVNAAMLANHGLVGLGRTVEEALLVCMVVEKAARVYAISTLFGQVNVLPGDDVKILREMFLNSYGQQ